MCQLAISNELGMRHFMALVLSGGRYWGCNYSKLRSEGFDDTSFMATQLLDPNDGLPLAPA